MYKVASILRDQDQNDRKGGKNVNPTEQLKKVGSKIWDSMKAARQAKKAVQDEL